MVYQWLEENYLLLKNFGLINPIEFDLLQYIYASNFRNNESLVDSIFPKFSIYPAPLLEDLLSKLVSKELLAFTNPNSYSYEPTQKAHDLFTQLDKAYSQFPFARDQL